MRGWIVTRRYDGDGVLPWQEACETEDRPDVENHCRDNRIAFERQPSGGLRTRQCRAAVIRHPSTGKRADVPSADLPFDTRFGDGTSIATDTVRAINEAHETSALREPWQRGDLLLVDNVRVAPGRDAYAGDRTVALVMTGPVSLADGNPSVDPFPPL
ncbi:TauD/TfdA family dioxygenase [Saccharothrix sp. NRRL B-16314]|uniref:TauD/TfdA family dioxygenase n=1 Tax=Saccharothrix sp. NRRL B-16314 TaxID=1463825 RepID=UPI0005249DCD|nr:TauD/TfdA family dioxygenase [Saccharothrix sp. NRRL B-16314]